jgi:putative selenium metabolism protein SsnA
MLYLKNATYINSKTFEFRIGNIKIEEGKNGNIEFVNIIPDVSKVIDCTGKYVTQSFVCGHHHIYSALARGMNAPKKNPTNFYEILEYVWWTLDKCLDKEMIEASALTTAISCAKNGVTYCIDHHASPNAIGGSLSVIADAFEKVGVSHLLCYEITDRDGMSKAEKGLEETDSYMQKRQALVGLHASFTVGNETLNKSVRLAEKYNSGIHIHVAEDLYDQTHCEENYGKRVVERLNDAGALQSSKTILGHCLHLSENERNIIRESGVWVVQNAESNLNNNVGFFNSKGLGENIMLGTDGMHSDMLRSAKAAFYIGQPFDNINYPGIYNRFRNANRYLKSNQIFNFCENNLVVFDYDSPTDFNQTNFLGHFLFGIEAKQITHVISSGKIIINDRRITTIDEDAVLDNSRKLSKILWQKMS